MGESRFAHRVKVYEAQARECDQYGYTGLATMFRGLIRRIRIGHIRTLAELDAAADRALELYNKANKDNDNADNN